MTPCEPSPNPRLAQPWPDNWVLFYITPFQGGSLHSNKQLIQSHTKLTLEYFLLCFRYIDVFIKMTLNDIYTFNQQYILNDILVHIAVSDSSYLVNSCVIFLFGTIIANRHSHSLRYLACFQFYTVINCFDINILDKEHSLSPTPLFFWLLPENKSHESKWCKNLYKGSPCLWEGC